MTMPFSIPDDQKNVAVALSGGGDSMALAHMMCVWAAEHGRNIHLLTVNHNLRNDAEAEARIVAQWVADFPNATHHILTWDFDDKPDTAVMERARQARYNLMADYCKNNDIQTLCVGHHADDQLETFLFRLAKGSGLDGLTGMSEWGEFGDLKIYRPLLGVDHNCLISYCENNSLKWVDDLSNQDDNYARPRLRKALAAEGLNATRFSKTLDRLQRGQKALNWMAEKTFNEFCMEIEGVEGKGAMINWDAIKTYPLDIQIRILQKSLTLVSNKEGGYPPKLERVEDIAQTLKPNKSATLFGCVLSLSKDGKSLEVVRATP